MGRPRARSATAAKWSYHRRVRLFSIRWPVPTARSLVGFLCLVLVLLSGGCKWIAQRYWLAKYDRQADEASQGYARAKSDGERGDDNNFLAAVHTACVFLWLS